VLGRRPAISKSRKLTLVARAALGKLFGSSTPVEGARHPSQDSKNSNGIKPV
jgi:hypothetical protein